MNKFLALVLTVFTASFLWADMSAFYAGKRLGKSGEWYHFFPGGGFVRLHQALCLPNTAVRRAEDGSNTQSGA